MAIPRITRLLTPLAVALLLVACSKVTEDNFAKLTDGMSETEVRSILGAPAETSSMSLGGLSGTSMVWRDKNAEIRVQFFNNQLKLKDFSRGN